MKKTVVAFTIMSMFLLISFAWQEELTPQQSLKKLNAKAESIELIEGTPKRKFQKIVPVWASAYTMENAIKKLKKNAAKKGADAIIEISIWYGIDLNYWGQQQCLLRRKLRNSNSSRAGDQMGELT